MGKTFLININCSKIFPNSEATHYTMFIDSSKMSIVYELVEWIRWMFSLQYCIYLMHEKSVIHELEDIQLLAELKNFEIIPCGGHHCVHKKMYRTLLENLNLIVSWNNMKVHKYFLDKINQMSQKLIQESANANEYLTKTTVQNLITFNTDKDNKKQINKEGNKEHFNDDQHLETYLIDCPLKKKMRVSNSCDKSGRCEESQSAVTSCFDQSVREKENILIQLEDSCGLSHPFRSLEAKKSTSPSPKKITPTISPMKNKFMVDQGSDKNHTKPKKIKPFSLGEFLSVIRKDYEEKDMEDNSSHNSTLISDKTNLETKIAVTENLFPVQDEVTSKRKRQRTRKRKRSRRTTPEEEIFPSFKLENKNLASTLSTNKSNYKLKPHHIRFDVEDEDEENMGNSEDVGDLSENELEINNEEININNSAFSENEHKQSVSFLCDFDQGASQKSILYSAEKKSGFNGDCLPVQGNEITAEENAICANDEKEQKTISSLESFQLNNSNHDLSNILSLREISKKGIVVERY